MSLSLKHTASYPSDSKWSVLQGQHEGRVSFIRRNDSAKQLQGHSEYVFRVGIAVPLLAPNEHGLPSNEEMELLMYIEDAVCEQLQRNQASLQVLTITTNGMREFVFYARDPKIVEGSMHHIQSKFPSHTIQFYIAEDKSWEIYAQFT